MSRAPLVDRQVSQWLLLFACSIILLAIVLWSRWEILEKDIAERTQTALAERGMSWATAYTAYQGRSVLLQGTAPNVLAAVEAEKIAEEVFGVRSATFIGQTLPPEQDKAYLRIWFDNGALSVVGRVSSENDISSISAALPIDPESVTNLLVTTDAQSSPVVIDWAQHVEFGYKVLTAVPFAETDAPARFNSVLVTQDVVRIEGFVPTTESIEIAKANVEPTSKRLEWALTPLEGALEYEWVATERREFIACFEKLVAAVGEVNILFDLGRADIRPDSAAQLNNLAPLITSCPNQLTLIGHTDLVGTNEVNQPLSVERAEVVKKALVELGASEVRIKTAGVGSSQPLIETQEPVAQEENRRVEFKFESPSLTTARPSQGLSRSATSE